MSFWAVYRAEGYNLPNLSKVTPIPENHKYRYWFSVDGIEIHLALGRTLRDPNFTTLPRVKERMMIQITFVDFELPREHEQAFTEWWANRASSAPSLVTNLLEDGYKLSVTPDFKNACIIVSVIGKDTGNGNKNKCFSSRSDDWLEAVGLALYKHYVIAEGSDWPTDNSRQNWG